MFYKGQSTKSEQKEETSWTVEVVPSRIQAGVLLLKRRRQRFLCDEIRARFFREAPMTDCVVLPF